MRYHDANPGITTRAYRHLPVDTGRQQFSSSYELLAHLVLDRTAPVHILDLACGDGYLLSLLIERANPQSTLIGIDISQGELNAAQARLGAACSLINGKAQSLALPSACLDAVTCHMALMLMDELDTVLSEIHRVLKIGARLAFVVGARPPPTAAFTTYVARLTFYLGRNPATTLRFGDPRLRTPEGIGEALSLHFTDVEIEDITLSCRYTPAALWEWFKGMYDLHFIPPDQSLVFRAECLADLEPLCEADGKVEFAHAFRYVVAKAAQAPDGEKLWRGQELAPP